MNAVTEIAGIITVAVRLYIQLQGIFGGKPIEEVIAAARDDNKAVLDKP